MRTRLDERGVALILSLIVLLVLSALALALLSVSALEPLIAKNLRDAARARWLAEAGLEVGYGVLIAAADADDSWSGLLADATGGDPWVTLPGLTRAALPGFATSEGTYSVSIRNDADAADATLTGEPSVDRDVTLDANGVVIMRSAGAFNASTRTLEVVVRRRRAAGLRAAGVRALHSMSNWRER